MPSPARLDGARGRDRGGDGHVEALGPVGAELEARVGELVPVRLLGDRLAAHQADDRVERLGHHRALAQRVDAHHERVGGQLAGARAEHHPSHRLVVELEQPVGEDQGWWYGREFTPVPSLIRRVSSAAAAMNTSGDATVSYPAEWCSPIHASS